MKRHSTIKLSALLLAIGLAGCSSNRPLRPEPTLAPLDPANIVGQQPAPPPGVVKYCWEEPIATIQPDGPGLDADGYYYHPFYLSAREVRMGRWRPCAEYPDETQGHATR